MNKDKLIKEIHAQLEGLRVIVKTCDKLTIEQAVALYDLQFRLKCKLYELTKEG